MFQALAENDVDRIKALLQRNTNTVHARRRDERTPLHSAALDSDTDLCRLFLASGADVNARDTYGAKTLACVATMSTIADVLTQRGA